MQIPTRSECVLEALGPMWSWTYIVSNAVIWLVYFTLPAVLLVAQDGEAHQGKLSSSERRHFWGWFGAFIFCCGTGHAMDGVGSWFWSGYKYFAVWHAITAVVSCFALAAIFRQRMRLIAAL
jgi:hypothetical protein